jgi:hypothetical protein
MSIACSSWITLNYNKIDITECCPLNLEGIKIRGHSTTKWTNFDTILTPSPPQMDKHGLYAEPPSPLLVHIVVE